MQFKQNSEALRKEAEETFYQELNDVFSDLESRDRLDVVFNFFERATHVLNAYQSRQKGARELRMSTMAWTLALGFKISAGAGDSSELAKKIGMSKQAVNKCLNHFLAQLKLPPLAGQRNTEARAHMSAARIAQLKDSPEAKAINRVLAMKDPT